MTGLPLPLKLFSVQTNPTAINAGWIHSVFLVRVCVCLYIVSSVQRTLLEEKLIQTAFWIQDKNKLCFQDVYLIQWDLAGPSDCQYELASPLVSLENKSSTLNIWTTHYLKVSDVHDHWSNFKQRKTNYARGVALIEFVTDCHCTCISAWAAWRSFLTL